MDRDTLRLILLVIGAIFLAGMYAWGRHKYGPRPEAAPKRRVWDEDDMEPGTVYSRFREEPDVDEEEGTLPPKPTLRPSQRYDRFDPMFSDEFDGLARPTTPEPPPPSPPKSEKKQPRSGVGAPFLIQVSVVARSGESFQGEELREALMDDLELIHGEMGIFHRYDRRHREPQFSIASLIEPGTFPIEDMENFECPGVVLFFQPGMVDDPLGVFDDLIETCHELARRMDAIEWDDRRQPLTTEKIAYMRGQMEAAFE